MPNYLPHPSDLRDALRYRRLRALVEYGDFLISDAHEDDRSPPREIDYAHELDAAIDNSEVAARGDALIKLAEQPSAKVD